MSTGAGSHGEVGCRGEQIGFARAEKDDHQVITAGDVCFRVGVGEPNLSGHFQEVVEMNGEGLWKLFVGSLPPYRGRDCIEGPLPGWKNGLGQKSHSSGVYSRQD